MLKGFINWVSKLFDKDITDEFRERITNPFFIALFFSWFMWNWELLFILFNFDPEYKLWEKIDCIKEYIRNDIGVIGFWKIAIENVSKVHLIWYPVGSSFCAIIFVSLFKQISLGINLFFINRVQPTVYRAVGRSKLIEKEKFEGINKRMGKLNEALQSSREEISTINVENMDLRQKVVAAEQRANDFQFKIGDIANENTLMLNKYKITSVFKERIWRLSRILENGEIHEEKIEIKNDNRYFSDDKYAFDVDMINVDKKSGLLKFRRVDTNNSRRKIISDLNIINENEYRGVEIEYGQNISANIIACYENSNQTIRFAPIFSTIIITKDERPKLNFKIYNATSTSLEVLSFSFSSFFNRETIQSGTFSFNLNVPPNKEVEKSPTIADPLKTYFKDVSKPGTYDVDITLSYRFNGTSEVKQITRTGRLIVKVSTTVELLNDWHAVTEKNNLQGVDYLEINLRNKWLESISCAINTESDYFRFGFKLMDKNASVLGVNSITNPDNNYLFHVAKEINVDRIGATIYRRTNSELPIGPGISYNKGMSVDLKLEITRSNELLFYMNSSVIYKTIIDEDVRARLFLMAWGDGYEFDLTAKNIIVKII